MNGIFVVDLIIKILLVSFKGMRYFHYTKHYYIDIELEFQPSL
jgi:hypothetical protein